MESPEDGPTVPPPTEAVSLAEAARRIGVHRRTLDRRLAAGTLHKQADGRVALAQLRALGYEPRADRLPSEGITGRLLDALQTAHDREIVRLWQQQHALAQELAACRQALEASQRQIAALQQQDAPASEPRPAADPAVAEVEPAASPAEPAGAALEAAPPGSAPGRVARAGLLAALGLLL